jgi:hypothetical protein
VLGKLLSDWSVVYRKDGSEPSVRLPAEQGGPQSTGKRAMAIGSWQMLSPSLIMEEIGRKGWELAMSDDLKRIYNHCDPYKPAADDFYLDCSAARGGGMLSQEFIRRLQLADDHLSFLFAGHIGCGKSSELAELCRRLERPEYGQPQYLPVLIDTNEYLDYYDADTTDIILAIVTELAAALRDGLGIELYDNYFVRRINEVKKFFLSEVEIAEGELPLWAAKLKVSRLKRDPDARQQVRTALAPKMSSMLEEINVVFEQARSEIRKKLVSSDASKRPDFVIILDNLEKVRRFGGREEGLDSQRELFVERYSQLAGLAAHCIYTLPLRLVRSTDGPQLAQRYDGDPFVLPMIKVCERATRGPFQLGLCRQSTERRSRRFVRTARRSRTIIGRNWPSWICRRTGSFRAVIRTSWPC